MKFNSIKLKISLSLLVILVVPLVVYRSFIYFGLLQSYYNKLDDELKVKAQEIAQTANAYLDALGSSDQRTLLLAFKRIVELKEAYPDDGDLLRSISQKWALKSVELRLEKDYVNFLNPAGKPLLQSGNISKELLAALSKGIKAGPEEEVRFSNIVVKQGNFNLRVITVSVSFKNQNRYILQVGTSREVTADILLKSLSPVAKSIPILLIIALLIMQVLVGQILKSVKEIARTAGNISSENLSARVKVGQIDREMKFVANAFNDMISRLEEAFKYVADFSSYVAHELKTPLAIIKGESEMALRKKRGVEELESAIKINLEETERMTRIIDDLLLLTKLDYRDEVFKFAKINTVEFLAEVYERSKILASQKEITVTMESTNFPIMINADALHLRRLFLNLIHNAIKFTPLGGKITIRVTLMHKLRTVLISIQDTGIGIPEIDLAKIFNRFSPVHKSMHSETGSGLGLSIAQAIARIHKGKIEVKSTVNKGSIFTVTLPLA